MDSNVEKISDMEAEIMKVVWSKSDPVTYSEIRVALNQKFSLGNQSIQTMIKRLVGKGVLKQEKQEVYLYSALVSESEYVKVKTISFLEKVFDGSAKGLMSALISYDRVKPDDLEELRKFWMKGGEKDE